MIYDSFLYSHSFLTLAIVVSIVLLLAALVGIPFLFFKKDYALAYEATKIDENGNVILSVEEMKPFKSIKVVSNMLVVEISENRSVSFAIVSKNGKKIKKYYLVNEEKPLTVKLDNPNDFKFHLLAISSKKVSEPIDKIKNAKLWIYAGSVGFATAVSTILFVLYNSTFLTRYAPDYSVFYILGGIFSLVTVPLIYFGTKLFFKLTDGGKK